ncbi:MAG: type II secretion system F family protein [Phycisphaerales bacterium]|nr:MAG: type II secretion system F family protein [Phycisphaerales bacterium]
MANFTYIARDAAGKRVTGTLAGLSEEAVLTELQTRELAPVQVQEVQERTRFRRRVTTRHLATAYHQLSDLLRAGVPLLRGLRLLGRSKANPRLAAVMNEIADDVADGARLADSMSAHGDMFPPIQVAMIRAGEAGAFLEPVLGRMGTFLEKQADMRGKVIGNLIYPAVLVTVGIGIVIFALLFFVPKFEKFYARIELPLPTKILLGASALLTSYWWLLLLLLAALVVLLLWLRKRKAVRQAVARWQLSTPRLGPLVQSIAVGRFARILGTLLENGIPLLPAMEISRDATGHVLLASAVDEAIEAVRAGETLAQPLADSGMFPEDVIEMISVGESANNLPEVLLTIAETIEKRVDRMMTVFIRLMEPALLLMLAGMVLFIFIALVVPMLRMSSALK